MPVKPKTCPQHILGINSIFLTPEHRGIEFIFQGKSVKLHVIRYYKFNINTELQSCFLENRNGESPIT
jgi:hypothetical protein